MERYCPGVNVVVGVVVGVVDGRWGECAIESRGRRGRKDRMKRRAAAGLGWWVLGNRAGCWVKRTKLVRLSVEVQEPQAGGPLLPMKSHTRRELSPEQLGAAQLPLALLRQSGKQLPKLLVAQAQ